MLFAPRMRVADTWADSDLTPTVWLAMQPSRLRRHRRRRMRVALCLLIAATGCAGIVGRARRSDDCKAPLGSPLTVIDSASRSLLEGSFRVTQVGSAKGRRHPTIRVLQLHRADSAERADARAKRLGNRPRNVDMVGTSTTEGTGQVDPAELDGNVLFIGCRECSDASPDAFSLFLVGKNGFAGRWHNPYSGITVVMRENSRNVLLSPGHYCAARLPTD